MEYRIGKIEGGFNKLGMNFTEPQRFVVNRELEDLVYYAMDCGSHRDLAEKFGLKNIIGGGYANFDCYGEDEKCLRIYGESQHYCDVSKDVMKGFEPELLRAYQEKYPSLERVFIQLRR